MSDIVKRQIKKNRFKQALESSIVYISSINRGQYIDWLKWRQVLEKVDIKRILKKVEKPARYLGNELNSIHKDTESNELIRYAHCFPDLYEVGMSHLGSHILYNCINLEDDVFCERVYAPGIDMEAKMREGDIPLFGLESREPIPTS